MAILSIQSQVVTGYVGNSVAGYALQRLGHEVLQLPTTLLSHHPGHGGSQGGALEPALLRRVLDGLEQRCCFARCRAVLSGYLADAENAPMVRRAVALAKTGMPGAIYLCDPVLGDDGRAYVSADIVAAMHNLAANADIVTPNAFELAVLSGDKSETLQDALRAMRRLQSMGPKIVVLTSFAGRDTAAGTLEMLAIDGKAAWRLTVSDLRRKFRGAGDLFAANFLAAWLARPDTGRALGNACSAVQAVLERTAAAASDELQLLTAPSRPASPPRRFLAERIS